MSNKEKLLLALEKLKSLSSSEVFFEEYPSKSDELNLPHCIKVKSQFLNKSIYSWGTDQDKDIAFLKALMESIERQLYFRYSPMDYYSLDKENEKTFSPARIGARYPLAKNWISASTSGMASHFDKQSSIDSALNELIERHTLLKAIYLKIPPLALGDFNHQENLSSRFNIPKDSKVDFFSWKGAFGIHIVLSRLHTSTGYFYRMGAHSNLEEAILKSFYEMTGVLLSEQSKSSPIKLTDYRPNSFSSTASARLFHQFNKETEFSKLLSQSSSKEAKIDSELCLDSFYFSKYSLNNDIYTTRVISPLTQAHFIGSWSKSTINPLALGQFKREIYEPPVLA